MSRICYLPKTFRAAGLEVIHQVNEICAEYAAQGYDLTVRQVYYQFVARGLMANEQRNYKRLKDIVNDGRLAGLIDWDYIVDRTRNLRSVSHWESPAEVIRAVAQQFRLDKWTDQLVRIEVWVEKEALADVVQQVADRLDVAWFACRGNVSQSAMWAAAYHRFSGYVNGGQRVVILHLGDHDPNGIDMTRDIRERLELFLGNNAGLIEVRRIALNFDQVQQYSPPPNFAKETDSRFAAYLREFGDQSWELDALEPSVLTSLIETHVAALRDDHRYGIREAEETTHRELLTAASSSWAKVEELLTP